MAWSVLQSKSATNAGSGNVTATFTTANLTSGSKLIAVVSVSCSSLSFIVSGVADGSSNSFTQLATKISGDFSTHLGLYAIDTPAGDAGTKPAITATIGTNFGASILVQEVSGLATGNTSAMLDGTPGTATGTASPATTGSYSSTAANEYLIAAYGDPGFSVTVSNATGYTADTANVNASSLATLFVDYKNSGNTAESASMTLSGPATWDTILAAFQLPAGGGANPAAGVAAAGGAAMAAAVITSNLTSGPRYATAASDLGGVYGSWGTPQYAEGGP